MLIYFLALITFVIWAALYCLYFREQIATWFANRFGKDKPPHSDETATGPVQPLDYTSHLKNE
ncbi:hypothetical protein JK202_06040 [Gluconobacter sp. Dm-62]|uniref:hypothetical protein n=1 Tax=Gluconobacter sp. Dm-62 TaxID=2799804 RepID=UPI001B8D9EE8|nr:hypothetical protein [Gluconobacter sp. Dm-62]MBS1102578.1 hypothetical protein [Gluconobacter sp. Dm-62]